MQVRVVAARTCIRERHDVDYNTKACLETIQCLSNKVALKYGLHEVHCYHGDSTQKMLGNR